MTTMTRENGKPPVEVKARLSHSEYFKLAQMIASVGEKFLRDRPTYAEAAKELSEKLGFLVIPRQVVDASKEVGMSWDPRVLNGMKARMRALEKIKEVEARLGDLEGRPVTNPELEMRLEQAEADLRTLRANDAVLRKLISHLYTTLGEATPKGADIFPGINTAQAQLATAATNAGVRVAG